jgi:hypothetical protein
MKAVVMIAASLILAGCAGNTQVEGERVTVDNGLVSVCGDGPGLPECRDYNGEPYSDELKYKAPTDKQMEDEAAKIRQESPEELQKTVSEMEQDPEAFYAE